MGDALPDHSARPIGPRSTAGELALRLADLAFGTFPAVEADPQAHIELADHIVGAAVRWINQRWDIGVRDDETLERDRLRDENERLNADHGELSGRLQEATDHVGFVEGENARLRVENEALKSQRAFVELDTTVRQLEGESETLKANLIAIFDQAVECHREPLPLMSFEDTLRHRLSTFGHAYEVQTIANVLEENRKLREQLNLAGEICRANGWPEFSAGSSDENGQTAKEDTDGD